MPLRQAAAVFGLMAIAAGGCQSVHSTAGTTFKVIQVVAAENEYGDVAAQVGGMYVRVRSIESNPNTDPHSFEVSTGVARAVSSAQVVVQNGIGYDGFMSKVESASPSRRRLVIDVQHLLGLPDRTANPHLWYDPQTMPQVADALAADFAALQPTNASYFKANAQHFIQSLAPWRSALTHFKTSYAGTPVAVTEPVADYMLEAAGCDILTPFRMQADVMNGVDPSPQDVAFEAGLLSGHEVKALLYNQQVTDPLTQSFISDARRAGIPIVGVYETMPSPGFDYQSWMVAEVRSLEAAVSNGTSEEKL